MTAIRNSAESWVWTNVGISLAYLITYANESCSVGTSRADTVPFVSEPHREPPPWAVNGIPVIIVGTVGWLIALVVLLATGTDTWWRWVCLTGLALGVVGIPIMGRYQRRHG
jgi:hypothetical protein